MESDEVGPPIRPSLKTLIEDTAREHNTWVDNFGLHSGEIGPLGRLIWELEKCVELAENLKEGAETDPEE